MNLLPRVLVFPIKEKIPTPLTEESQTKREILKMLKVGWFLG